jgi:hypothetical protein
MTIMQQKRGTAAEWDSNSTIVLAEGEIGVEYNTGKAKVGDGTSAWSALPYIGGGGGGDAENGLPAGGTAGQVLTKDSTDDYDTSWTSTLEGNAVAFKTRRDTQANWASNNTVLAAGEQGYETDTGLTKHGDGTTAWNLLAYSATGTTTYLVANQSGSTIPKGTLVSAVGVESSGRIDVAPFEVTGSQDSEIRVMGLAMTDIASGNRGTVISFGTLRNIDTRGNVASAIAVGDETWTAGDILYAHPTVDGKLTKVRPQHDLTVAFVTKVDATTGQIAVRVSPGNNHLEWMHDVAIGTLADKNLMAYESSTSLWKNKTFSDLGLATLASPALTGTPTAPTATAGTSTTQVATTAFVSTAVSNSTNWNSAYTDRLKWDGGSTGLTPATGRTSLGATTVGSNLFTLANPSAIRFLRLNADNTVSALSDADFRTAIGVGSSSGSGTVTSVGMTVPTGLSVTPSSITDAGTFAITLTTNYSIPLTADTAKGVSAYGWGDHSLAGYLSTTPAILGGSENLDTKDAPGLYHQNANVDAASGTNYPVPLAGMLTVSVGEGFIYQTYQTYGGSGTNRLYHRGKYDGNWSTWRNVTDGADRYSGSAWTGSNVIMVAGSAGAVTAPSLRPDGGALQAGDLWITW